MSMIFKASPMGEIADIDEKMGIVKGYGSYFGNKDSDNDVIAKGAYQKTIKENGDRVRYLYQHDMGQPIGKMKELFEDDKGLMFVAEIPKTTLGMDVLELIKGGVITENSVGILPLQRPRLLLLQLLIQCFQTLESLVHYPLEKEMDCIGNSRCLLKMLPCLNHQDASLNLHRQ